MSTRSRIQLHGLKHHQKLVVVSGSQPSETITLICDTRNDPDWVVVYKFSTHDYTQNTSMDEVGPPVARQAKLPGSRVFRQCSPIMGSPDYEGYLTYKLEYWSEDNKWRTYDDQAKKGDILNQLHRLVDG
jgi:hypothetical protein